jgi:hypothetical protein
MQTDSLEFHVDFSDALHLHTVMWRDDPASEKQLEYLNKFGYTPSSALTKGQASDLIERFKNDPKRQDILLENDMKEEAYNLHTEVDEAKKDPELDLEDALRCRLSWWMGLVNMLDTGDCCSQLHMDLWEAYARHFVPPTEEQTQTILDALDNAMPTWDKTHPQLFFETLELNHPDLRIGTGKLPSHI